MSRVGLFGQISEINGHLYLSGAGVLRPDKLRDKKITCIINATTEEPMANLSGIDCLRIRIEDNPFANLSNYFDMVADKIKAIKDQGGKTLVHCVAGVSRSASLVIVYLVKHEKMTLRQAYHYVKSARPIIRPNIGFWKQMVDYERRLRGHSTVTMIKTSLCDMPIPDIYTQDIKRHMLAKANEESAQALRSKAIPISTSSIGDYSKRRGLSASAMESMRSRSAAGIGQRHNHSGNNSNSAYNPWRHAASLSLVSPAPARRRENLFGNLYNSSREAFFSAF
jgi:atypical dual specificity phosphatase|uniref:Protein-tyrosine-phosphatase n=1 Tax=Panagrolaimus sp. PS1159 TaxID=55785 RepID=A0AC35EUL4_9BILA